MTERQEKLAKLEGRLAEIKVDIDALDGDDDLSNAEVVVLGRRHAELGRMRHEAKTLRVRELREEIEEQRERAGRMLGMGTGV